VFNDEIRKQLKNSELTKDFVTKTRSVALDALNWIKLKADVRSFLYQPFRLSAVGIGLIIISALLFEIFEVIFALAMIFGFFMICFEMNSIIGGSLSDLHLKNRMISAEAKRCIDKIETKNPLKNRSVKFSF
jgi:sulfite exporter TauE/SafE